MLFSASVHFRHSSTAAVLTICSLFIAAACSPASTGRELDVPGESTAEGSVTTVAPPVAEVIALAESGEGGFAIESPAFGPGDDLPEINTAAGQGLSPALTILNVPSDAVELALVVTDVDNADFVHWLVSGIAPTTPSFPEGVAATDSVEHFNGAGEFGWFAPSRTPGTVHRFRFQLYALDSPLNLEADHDIPVTIDTIERQAISRSSTLAVLVG